VDLPLATSIGLDEDATNRLMQEVGFAKTGDNWKWRGRRHRHERVEQRPGNAFAGLAALKR
jgi:ATP-dependent RNA helicase SUPV3L1/SUV3